MTSRRAWWLIMAVGLVTIMIATAASDASAASKGKRARHIAPMAGTATVGAAQSCRGGQLFRCGPVYNGTDYLGNDPDPFIRLMIQRDLGAKYGGES
jgi:hypothetical protein